MSSEPAPARTSPQVTELLIAWRTGNSSALDQLVPLIEAELRQLARRYLRRERPGHCPPDNGPRQRGVVRLLNWQNVSWQNRAHFVAMAARLMRNILVDLARRRAKDADGFSVRVVDIAEAQHVARQRTRDVVLLDDALKELARRDPRKARIVELRFFGGLNLEEIAEAIEVSPVTVSREWAKARAWLHREVTLEAPEDNRRRRR